MLYIRLLLIDDHVVDKMLRKHGVELHEAEEVCYSLSYRHRRGRSGLDLVFGQTDAGRYLTVVLADKGGGLWKIVTARDMAHDERRLYRRMLGG